MKEKCGTCNYYRVSPVFPSVGICIHPFSVMFDFFGYYVHEDNTCELWHEKESCANCKYNCQLHKWDYSKRLLEDWKEDMEGYACMAFASEGHIIWKLGDEPEKGICEMWRSKNERNK